MGLEKFHIVSDNGICSILNRNLYRYHTINQHLLNSFLGNYIWFSNPEDFNDPYDCNLDFNFKCTHEELETYSREINNWEVNAHRKVSELELQSRVTAYINNPELLGQRYREHQVQRKLKK